MIFRRKKTPGYQLHHLIIIMIYGMGQIWGIDAGIVWLELIALLIFNIGKKPHLILGMGTNLFLKKILKSESEIMIWFWAWERIWGLVPIATDSPVNEPALVIGSLCCKYTSAAISSIYIKFDTLQGSCPHQHHERNIDIIMKGISLFYILLFWPLLALNQ